MYGKQMILTLLTGLMMIPATFAAETNPVVAGNTRFALELYEKLQSQEGNLFLSPYSISTALAMTYGGARGQTAEQMSKALHFGLPEDKLHPAFAALIKQINGEGGKRSFELSTANSLWGQKSYPFRKEFLALTQDNYGAGLQEVDFMGATEQARLTINAWVEKETRDKIKELLKAGVLTTDTRLVLTNAIYFKGTWAHQFKKDLTRDGAFHLGKGAKVDAPLMHQTGMFDYADLGDFQMLAMPYKGKDLSMVVLLPKKQDGLAELEKHLKPEALTAWLGKLRQNRVNVTLPRFKTTAEFSLNKQLSELGMTDAFDPGKADFSGMNGGSERLSISHVIHKAFVDVNEEGTEAAAATAVVVETRSVPAMMIEFRADHPFLFLIRDNRNESVLFLGRLADPTR